MFTITCLSNRSVHCVQGVSGRVTRLDYMFTITCLSNRSVHCVQGVAGRVTRLDYMFIITCLSNRSVHCVQGVSGRVTRLDCWNRFEESQSGIRSSVLPSLQKVVELLEKCKTEI